MNQYKKHHQQRKGNSPILCNISNPSVNPVVREKKEGDLFFSFIHLASLFIGPFRLTVEKPGRVNIVLPSAKPHTTQKPEAKYIRYSRVNTLMFN